MEAMDHNKNVNSRQAVMEGLKSDGICHYRAINKITGLP